MQIVQEIHGSIVANKDQHFSTQYADFKKQYPNLYTMACSGKIKDMTTLEFMLDMLDKVKNNENSTHEASVEVGQRLFNTFVNPKLKDAVKSDNPNPAPVFSIR